MSISSHHTDKRIIVLLLLIVAMLVGMYVVTFNKVTTNSQAAGYLSSPGEDGVCKTNSGDPNAYCKNRFTFCKTGFTSARYTCGKGLLGNCCVTKNGTGVLSGSDTDLICRNNTGNPAAYCVAVPFVKCAAGFTSQGSCGANRHCCVPGTAAAAPTRSAPPEGFTNTDCGTSHENCSAKTPPQKCSRVSAPGFVGYSCVSLNYGSPRPTAGSIPEGQTNCPLPVGDVCSSQGNRWGPADSAGNKTCYAICGGLYTRDEANKWCVHKNLGDLKPCCEEAIEKPFLFSNKACCGLLTPDQIKSVFNDDESVAKQNCPSRF